MPAEILADNRVERRIDDGREQRLLFHDAGLRPPPGRFHRPAQDGDSNAGGEVERYGDALAQRCERETAARRQQKVVRRKPAKDHRRKRGAEPAIPRRHQDREEERGKGKPIAQKRVEQKARPDGKGHAGGSAGVTKCGGAAATGSHGLLALDRPQLTRSLPRPFDGRPGHGFEQRPFHLRGPESPR